MPLEPRPDEHWTAFLYVAGELTPEQASAFEDRLAEDQALREAVAEAVELAGALAILPPSRPRALSRARRPLMGMGLAAAACLAAAVVPILRPSKPDTSEVAMAWSGLRLADRVEGDGDWTTWAGESPAPGAVEPAPPTDSEPDASPERTLPSWLLTAASADAHAHAPSDTDHPLED